MNVLILEDSLEFIDRLKEIVLKGQLGTFLKLSIEAYNDNFQSIDFSRNYGLIFIDIHLNEYDGMKLADELKQRYPDAALVFVTADDSLVFQSLTVQPFFFIRKECFDEDYELFEKMFVKHYNDHYMIAFTTRSKKVNLRLKDIVYIEVVGHKLNIKTIIGETYTISKSMQDIKKEIKSNKLVQIHRSFLINMDYLYSVSSNTVSLSNGDVLNIGRNYKKDFQEIFQEYLMNGGI
ncbi:LytTR family DNA-binding domain-containing protein [Coprobacillus sp. AF33-1AC]|uniref:LytR/AlgR family response regulator transcription factor n=1 Tax=Coprobacillus sp. AF33-1AC TaxID=2292032 RepID=UPI000E535DBC|nr:LytTR family DNA-binding domain-containing protein [Coprobacillus sp. AF33-1AC]RHM60905.1 DNA-binding response regulator [Coprobacillus sp. AF33-1AC]